MGTTESRRRNHHSSPPIVTPLSDNVLASSPSPFSLFTDHTLNATFRFCTFSFFFFSLHIVLIFPCLVCLSVCLFFHILNFEGFLVKPPNSSPSLLLFPCPSHSTPQQLILPPLNCLSFLPSAHSSSYLKKSSLFFPHFVCLFSDNPPFFSTHLLISFCLTAHLL